MNGNVKAVWGIPDTKDEDIGKLQTASAKCDKSADENSKDKNSESLITVKAISLNGCTLFPGSTVSYFLLLIFI